MACKDHCKPGFMSIKWLPVFFDKSYSQQEYRSSTQWKVLDNHRYLEIFKGIGIDTMKDWEF